MSTKPWDDTPLPEIDINSISPEMKKLLQQNILLHIEEEIKDTPCTCECHTDPMMMHMTACC